MYYIPPKLFDCVNIDVGEALIHFGPKTIIQGNVVDFKAYPSLDRDIQLRYLQGQCTFTIIFKQKIPRRPKIKKMIIEQDSGWLEIRDVMWEAMEGCFRPETEIRASYRGAKLKIHA